MKYAISSVLCLSLSGCTMGPELLRVQRYKYNEAIQESTAEQLLLNIVRLRYNDSPMFLNVGDIDARFTLETSSTASGTIRENVGAAPLNANSAEVSASSKFIDNPNIKLRPMQDTDFIRLLEPLTSADLLALVTRRQSRLLYEHLALAMQSYTYRQKPEDGGEEKTVDAYRNTSAWKRFLQILKVEAENGELLIESNTVVKEEFLPTYAPTAIAPQDVMKAKLAGLRFLRKGEDEYVLIEPTTEWTLALTETDYVVEDPSGRERKFQLPPMRLEFAPGNAFELRDEDTKLSTATLRSILQMMYCLSRGVEVPSPHENERNGPPAEHRILGFHVECSALPPLDAFVSVKYRGYWFYIKRSDMESKKFLSVLTELFVERAGKPATTPTTLGL